MQRQGRSGAEARRAPVACPSFAQPAPSWAGSLAGRQVWVRLAQGRAASRQELCQIGPLSRAGALPYWRRTWLWPSRALAARGWAASASPGEARFPTNYSLGFKAEARCASCRSRQLHLSWGGRWRPHTQGQAPATCTRLCSEESAREPTCVRQLLGAHGVSLWVCGAADPSQGPWEPGALRVALSLSGQATCGGALHLSFSFL